MVCALVVLKNNMTQTLRQISTGLPRQSKGSIPYFENGEEIKVKVKKMLIP